MEQFALIQIKKLISCMAICVLIGYPAVSQLPKSDWEVMKLKGNVKSVIDTIYTEFISSRKMYIKTLTFDNKGNIIQDIITNDKRSDTITNIYNEKGLLAEIRAKNITSFTHVLDSKGNILEYSRFNDGKLYDRQVYKYDEKGNPSEMNFYLRNPNTFKLKEWHYGPYFFKYDEKGNLIEEPRRNEDGWSFSQAKYTLDEKGNRVKMQMNDYNYTFKYDENGNQTERKILKPNGKPLKEDTPNEYEYEYDAHQNWTKRIELLYTVKFSSTRRTIIYY